MNYKKTQETAQNKIKAILGNDFYISDFIAPYFNYFLSKYPPQTGAGMVLFTVPVMEGSASMDQYFINPLLKNGFCYKDCFLLHEIYIYK